MYILIIGNLKSRKGLAVWHGHTSIPGGIGKDTDSRIKNGNNSNLDSLKHHGEVNVWPKNWQVSHAYMLKK